MKCTKNSEETWRTELNHYELNLLLPALKERVKCLNEYFGDLLQFCERHRSDPTFGAMLIKLTTAPSGARLITPTLTDAQMSEKFFSEIIEMAAENYLNPISQLLPKFDEELDLTKFAELMNRTNNILSSVLQAKDKLFLYEFSSFYSLHDTATGQVIDVVPRELTVLLMPFKNLLQNMTFICEGVVGTIQAWHKEQIEWRTRTLDLNNSKLNRQNQVLTIVVAFALSILFFAFTDAYKMYQLERLNETLSTEVARLSAEIKGIQGSDPKSPINMKSNPKKADQK